MPELPEVESIVQVCSSLLEGHTLEKLAIFSPKLRFFLSENLLYAADQGIKKIYRRAKYMIWDLEDGALIFHFGMTGTIAFRRQLKKHDHLFIQIGEQQIYYNDPRRFGMVWFTLNSKEFFAEKKIGIEPFSAQCTKEYLFEKAAARSMAIKVFLFDQHVIAGLGNIYINEALYHSQINPFARACTLSLEDWDRLLRAIRFILTEAINAGGSTLQDYTDPHGCVGLFQHEHKVYHKDQCLKCTSQLISCQLAQRSTFYCPICQPLTA